MRKVVVSAALAVCCVIGVQAQALDPAAPANAASAPADPLDFEWRFTASSVSSDTEPQLQGEAAAFGLGIRATWRSRTRKYLAYDIDLLMLNREYSTTVLAPPWGTVDDRMTLTTGVLSGGVRLTYPAESATQVYGLGGLAWISNTLTATGSIIGLPAYMDETDSELSFYYGAGVRFVQGDFNVFVEYRYLENEGDFGSFYADNVDISPNMVGLGLGVSF